MIRWTNRAAILHGVILSQAPAVVGVAKRYKTNHFFHHVLIIIISQTQSFGRQTQRYGIQVSDTTQRKTESSGRPTRFKSGRFSTFVFSVVLFILYVNVAWIKSNRNRDCDHVYFILAAYIAPVCKMYMFRGTRRGNATP